MRNSLLAIAAITSLAACDGEKAARPAPESAPAAAPAEPDQAVTAGRAAESAGGEAGAAAEKATTAEGAPAADSDPAEASDPAGTMTGSETAPADFPLPVPAGTDGIFGDTVEEGVRERFGTFRIKGSVEDLAAACEKAIRARGLAPSIQRQDLGVSKLIKIEATKGGVEISVNMATDSEGAVVAMSWKEPAR